MDEVIAEYSSEAASLWTDYVNWNKRREGENGFLENSLARHGCKKVLDAAMGDGCDAIHLLKKGFSAVGNELSPHFARLALAHAKREKVELPATGFDWREFGEKFDSESFDAVFLLGNSLCCLLDAGDRLHAVEAFKKILREKGVLLVDERNYECILSNRSEILKGNFKGSGKFAYCGDNVRCAPVEISGDKVVLQLEHENGAKARLSTYPFKRGELLSVLREAGFGKITQYSDYSPGFDESAEFYQYVAVK